MNIQHFVREDFKEFIRISPKVPDDLRTALKLNERVPLFIDNITAEIDNVEKQGVILDRAKIKEIVYNMSELFVVLMKRKADEMRMTDAAKSALKAKHEGDEFTQAMDKEGNLDLSKDLGIKIVDAVPTKKRR